MVTYQPYSPSRMCNMARLMRRFVYYILGRSYVSSFWIFSRRRVCICMPLKHPYPRVDTHRLAFGPRVAHCPEATHVCIVRAPVPPPHTHVPAPHHTLISHIPPLLLDVQRLSSAVSQASGMGHQAGLVCSLPAPQPNASLTR
jgi:hypothetical protein